MNTSWQTAACTAFGAIAGAAFIAQSWGLLLAMILLLLPWKLMGEVTRKLIIQLGEHYRQREIEQLRREEKGEIVV